MPVSHQELVGIVKRLRSESVRIVFTNGCFDILHRGHVEYLAASAALGDLLVVGLNSDASVTRLKGAGRPINTSDDRAAVLEALRSVSVVTIFDDPTPIELIRLISPDVLVKGGDYNPDAIDGNRYIVGSDIVRSYGGEVRVIDMVAGRSTTNIISKISGSGS